MSLPLFERVGGEPEDVARSKLRSLRRLLLLTMACEAWFVLSYVPYSRAPGGYGLLAAGITMCALLGWRDRFALPALAGAALLEFVLVGSAFPDNANHQFLALVLGLLLLLVRRDGDDFEPTDARTCLQATRWVILIGLAWAGVMKLVYGYWLGAEFLSFRVALDPDFAWIFSPLVPESEWQRLVGLENALGAGPFRADAPALVVLSNLTWVAELLLPVGLLFARTRRVAMIGALALLWAIQLGAGEVFFAGLMTGGLLLFAERDRLRPALAVIGLFYLAQLLADEWAGLGQAGGGG